jgi:hypothetical protein
MIAVAPRLRADLLQQPSVTRLESALLVVAYIAYLT